ncbi:MAG: rod shape-determining protein MreD [Leptolyngbyaceae cyanobacterium RU_5_1]|nr:rod shape-determining protein MreD [Leptolyngbyaceae cyanobacterium RU_5_1]
MKTESLIATLQDRPIARIAVNSAVTAASVLLCLLVSPTRLLGMELAGIGPNWLLIWVVAWSVKRTAFHGALAGLTLGLIQDGMTAHEPTHTLSLMLVGILTARLRKERYLREDFISVALIAFGMAVIAETVTAIQYSFQGDRSLVEIWTYHQLIALGSAVLSSMWAPIVYFPLKHWWQQMSALEQQT